MIRAALIIHGRISGSKRDEILNSLKKYPGIEWQLMPTSYAGHAMQLAREAVLGQCSLIACAGGDGSINEVVNGMMQAFQQGTPELKERARLLIIPRGTGNDFVKTIGSPFGIPDLMKLLAKDHFISADLGLVHYTDLSGKAAERYFLNITDVGMGGEVAERLSGYSKWMGPLLTYQRAILTTLMTYKHRSVQAKIDGKEFSACVMNFVVANGKYFGSGLGIAPEADPADGLLDIVILGKISLLDYARNIKTVQACKRIEHPELTYSRAKEISVQSAEGPMPIDMDGELLGYSPMKISIVPSAIKIITA